MHSSRMRIGRSLTVSRGGSASWGGLLLGGSAFWGECLLLWGGLPLWGGWVVSHHALRQTPTVNRMTDRCKNITLATTSLRPVKKSEGGILSIELLKVN